MKQPIKPFALAQYLSEHEFSAKYLLSCSDVEGRPAQDLIKHADKESHMLWENLHLGYTQPKGFFPLKREIQKIYKNVSLDEIFQTSSVQESIYILLQNLLKPGDHVVSIVGYQAYQAIPEAIGATVSLWKPSTSVVFDVEDFKNLITPKTKVAIINFPHNPTGTILEKNAFRDLVLFCKERDIYLISDEIFRGSELNESDQLPPAVEMTDGAISITGLSKVFGLAGLRIGWAIVKDKKLLAKISKYKDYTTICSSAPSEILATMALKQKERILLENTDIIQKNKVLFNAFLQKNSDKIKCKKPQSMLCFPEIITGESSMNFCKRAVEKSGIMLTPANIFDLGDTHFRIGLGRKNFEVGLKLLDNFL